MERAFGNLKDVIHLRPVYHRQEGRVRGHIFVAALAFLVQHALERKLKRAGVSFSAMEALQALRTVQIVGSKAGDVPRCGHLWPLPCPQGAGCSWGGTTVPAVSQGDDLIPRPDDKQPPKAPILNLVSYTNVKHGLVTPLCTRHCGHLSFSFLAQRGPVPPPQIPLFQS